MAKKAVVLLANGFEEIEAVTPIDILRRAGLEVTVAGVGGMTLTGSHGLVVSAETPVAGIDANYDMLVLPGGGQGSENLGKSPEAKRLAGELLAAGKIVGAICAAPVLTLGAWGFLSGKKATCFPGMESRFPKDVAFSSDPVVVDDNIITSRGAGTAMAFSLALVAGLLGRAAADDIAREIVLTQP